MSAYNELLSDAAQGHAGAQYIVGVILLNDFIAEAEAKPAPTPTAMGSRPIRSSLICITKLPSIIGVCLPSARDVIAEKMAPAQIAKAKRLAAPWRDAHPVSAIDDLD